MAVTGWAGGPPTQPEFPLTDYTAGMMGAAAALLELRASKLRGDAPSELSFATHETLLRMNEWQIVMAAAVGRAEQRVGNRLPMNTNVGTIFRTRDDKLLTVSAATQDVIMRLIAMVGGDEAVRDPRFKTLADRKIHMDALEAIIEKWMREHDLDDAMQKVLECDVVAGPIFSAADLEASPQVAFRKDVVTVNGLDDAPIAMPAVLPHFLGAEGKIKHAGPALGADSEAILKELEFSEAEILDFRACGAIWC
jgi:crotonobetainyl-CoA:carnitine CoA-transferase CaiB-like acyl-CoA transferase